LPSCAATACAARRTLTLPGFGIARPDLDEISGTRLAHPIPARFLRHLGGLEVEQHASRLAERLGGRELVAQSSRCRRAGFESASLSRSIGRITIWRGAIAGGTRSPSSSPWS
jgi:hypothetical protein